MVTCGRCGESITDDVGQCPKCGAAQGSTVPQTDEASAPKKDRTLFTIAVLLVIMLVAVVLLTTVIHGKPSVDLTMTSGRDSRISLNVTAVTSSTDIELSGLVVTLRTSDSELTLDGGQHLSLLHAFAVSDDKYSLSVYDVDGSGTLTVGDWIVVEPVAGILADGGYDIDVYYGEGAGDPSQLGGMTVTLT